MGSEERNGRERRARRAGRNAGELEVKAREDWGIRGSGGRDAWVGHTAAYVSQRVANKGEPGKGREVGEEEERSRKTGEGHGTENQGAGGIPIHDDVPHTDCNTCCNAVYRGAWGVPWSCIELM